MPRKRNPESQRLKSQIYSIGYVESINGKAHTRIKGRRCSTGLRFDVANFPQLRELLDERIRQYLDGGVTVLMGSDPDRAKASAISPSKTMTIHTAIEEFTGTKQYKQASAPTKNFYLQSWRSYLPVNMPMDHTQLYLEIDRRMQSPETTSAAWNTQRKRLYHLKRFCSWCVAMGYLEQNPFSRISIEKEEINEVIPFTQDEADAIIDRLLGQPANRVGGLYVRMLDRTAMRAGECLSLERANILPDTMWIKGKGDQRRAFPLGHPLFMDAKEVVEEVVALNLHQDRLWHWNHYNKVALAVTEAKAELGIVDTITNSRGVVIPRALHAFRKTCINRWRLMGLSSETRALLAGHDAEVQKRYYLKVPDGADLVRLIETDVNRTD